KPIVAAAALERGMPVTKTYSSPYEMPYPSPVATCSGNYVNTSSEELANENETEVGPYSMKEATALSVNTYFVQMISEIGTCPVIELSKKMGIERSDGNDFGQGPSIALGTQEVSPLTMASAYATFATRGTYCSPIAIASITGPDKKSMPVPKSTCTKVMSEKTADTVNTLLRGVVEDGTGRQAGLEGRASAGKTGTTDFRYAAWFAGYTPNLSGAVWVGDPQHKRQMVDITIGGRPYDKVFGGEVPGPIWKTAMAGALEGREAPGFNLVDIPEPSKPGKNKPNRPGGGNGNGGGDNKPGGNRPGGGDNPFPDVELPGDWFGGGQGR
ncbi:transglycosylase domain-containing protein, partial [Streptomyces sp. ADI96-15]